MKRARRKPQFLCFYHHSTLTGSIDFGDGERELMIMVKVLMTMILMMKKKFAMFFRF